ncbi:MAG: hypothetical protein BMS9Abin26_1012 [Gammaproteobacteria bacterium]|nr:MAG: hypothetical protein BMS9Abin26_1012 [Gammaproteobacteria bacterium]
MFIKRLLIPAAAVMLSLFVLPHAVSASTTFNFLGTNNGTLPVINQTIGGISLTVTPQFSIDPASTLSPTWYNFAGQAGRGIYDGSTGLGVKSYDGDNSDLDGSRLLESLVFTFDRTVTLTSIFFGSMGSNDDFNLDVGGANVLRDVAPNPSGSSALRNSAFLLSGYTGSVFRIWADASSDDFRVGNVVVQPVPEPTTWLMMLLGLFLMTGIMRHRRS